jgi:hypothetical protein
LPALDEIDGIVDSVLGVATPTAQQGSASPSHPRRSVGTSGRTTSASPSAEKSPRKTYRITREQLERITRDVAAARQAIQGGQQ